jgi:hypothetical protein
MSALVSDAHAQGAAQPAPPSTSQACIDAHVEAQRARKRGALRLAREKLLSCAQSSCPGLVSNDCTAWLSEVEASVPSIVLAVVDAEGRDLVEVAVSANGQRWLERIDGKATALDPGSYELTFSARGYTPLKVALTVRQAEKDRLIRVQLARDPSAEPSRGGVPVLSYVLGGVAIAGFGTFVYFGVRGQDEYDEAERTCGTACSDDQVADGKLAWIVADIGLGVGLASAAAATILYLVSQQDDDAETATRIDVAPSQDGARVQWTARF